MSRRKKNAKESSRERAPCPAVETAMARRSATVVRETVLRVGDLELARTVSRGGRNIALLPREFQVLEYWFAMKARLSPGDAATACMGSPL
jgi:DNA-binding response OmpR family regulator